MFILARLNDENILAALLSAGSVRGAAKIAGCSEVTIRARLKNDAFRSRYEEAKDGILSEAMDSLSAHLSAAVETIGSVMADNETPASVRVSAADSVLRHGLRYIEAGNILKRLEALEAAQAEEKEQNKHE